MDLRQLTVYEHFGCVNMRAITRGRFLKKNCGNAKLERRRRERIEAPKALRWVGCGEGVSPSPSGGVWPQNFFFDFRSQIGEFWCKLGAFCAVHLKLV